MLGNMLAIYLVICGGSPSPEINRGLLENHSFLFLGTCLKNGHPKMPKKETQNLNEFDGGTYTLNHIIY